MEYNNEFQNSETAFNSSSKHSLDTNSNPPESPETPTKEIYEQDQDETDLGNSQTEFSETDILNLQKSEYFRDTNHESMMNDDNNFQEENECCSCSNKAFMCLAFCCDCFGF